MKLSTLPKTWLIDLDGTVLLHSPTPGGEDRLLPGVRALWAQFGPQDQIVLLSTRDPYQEQVTRRFLDASGLRYDRLIFGLPPGERILIGDREPSGAATAIAVNLTRNEGPGRVCVAVDPAL
jgi:hypothetical protein